MSMSNFINDVSVFIVVGIGMIAFVSILLRSSMFSHKMLHANDMSLLLLENGVYEYTLPHGKKFVCISGCNSRMIAIRNMKIDEMPEAYNIYDGNNCMLVFVIKKTQLQNSTSSVLFL